MWPPSAKASAACNSGNTTSTHTGHMYEHMHARTPQTGNLRELKEPLATEYSRPVPLFYCKSHLKGRELKGISATDDSELIKAALVGTWVVLALRNNRGSKNRS